MTTGGSNSVFLLPSCFSLMKLLPKRADTILDARNGLPRSCQDRPRLITTLADVLLEYDRNCTYEEREKPHLRWNLMQKVFAHLGWILGSFLRLRGKEGFATDPGLKHIHRPTLEHAYDTIAQVVEALTPEDFVFICQHELQWKKMLVEYTEYNLATETLFSPATCQRDWLSAMYGPLTPEDFEFIRQHELQWKKMLVEYTEYNPATETLFSPATFEDDSLPAMYDAFKQYGPSRDYPNDAIFHALAAIRLQFALAEGDRPTVAARLLKQWQRQKTEAAKREAERAADLADRLLRR